MALVKKKYKYTGPPSSVTLRVAGEADMDVAWVDGKEYTLPAAHQYVVDLCELKMLTEVASEPVAQVKAVDKPQDSKVKES
jgi:hypothetical protein